MNTGDLWWSPIPYEFLYQDVTTTQVTVTSNGVEGLCMIGGCDFAYIADDTAVVTSWTKTGDSITIAGTGLPVSGMTISFGPRNCIVSSASTTQITCSLDAPALAGTHSVEIVKPFGHIGGSLS